MKTWQSIILGILLGVMITLGIRWIFSQPQGTPIILLPSPTPSPIQVHVTGAVNAPGLYYLPSSSRVKEAIDAAGGLHPSAAVNTVNLAARIQDGERLNVPFISTPAPLGANSSGAEAVTAFDLTPTASKVNINTASIEALEKLPGIGPTRAEQIIAYRAKNGAFKRIEDLQKVSGIGSTTFERLKPLITVNP